MKSKKVLFNWVGLAALGIGVCSSGCFDPSPVYGDPVDSWGTDVPEIDTEGMTLVWEDTFDGAEGSSPDAAKWGFDVGGSGWGNEQLEYDTARPENASLDGQGHLVITARKESYQGKAYTSARMTTGGTFSHTYGRYSATIKLPIGQGIWPAFWLLGTDIGDVGWPDCGEVDIMEFRGQEDLYVIGSLHGPEYSGGQCVTKAFSLPDESSFHDDFHVFAIEWEPDEIRWFVDGYKYQVVDRDDIPSGADWVFDHEFFIILNLAVGGTYLGSPDETIVFPQTMLVDDVRVYDLAP